LKPMPDEWWHVIDLPDGSVTPGGWDLRDVARQLPWPDLSGKRCLDVGTADGFWAFEMEKRGAADVLATDLPTPFQARARERFAYARDALPVDRHAAIGDPDHLLGGAEGGAGHGPIRGVVPIRLRAEEVEIEMQERRRVVDEAPVDALRRMSCKCYAVLRLETGLSVSLCWKRRAIFCLIEVKATDRCE